MTPLRAPCECPPNTHTQLSRLLTFDSDLGLLWVSSPDLILGRTAVQSTVRRTDAVQSDGGLRPPNHFRHPVNLLRPGNRGHDWVGLSAAVQSQWGLFTDNQTRLSVDCHVFWTVCIYQRYVLKTKESLCQTENIVGSHLITFTLIPTVYFAYLSWSYFTNPASPFVDQNLQTSC